VGREPDGSRTGKRQEKTKSRDDLRTRAREPQASKDVACRRRQLERIPASQDVDMLEGRAGGRGSGRSTARKGFSERGKMGHLREGKKKGALTGQVPGQEEGRTPSFHISR